MVTVFYHNISKVEKQSIIGIITIIFFKLENCEMSVTLVTNFYNFSHQIGGLVQMMHVKCKNGH